MRRTEKEDSGDPRHRYHRGRGYRGDLASVALAAPEAGALGARRVARYFYFAGNPNHMRLLGAAQMTFGVRLALQQYRRD